jgi:hypothetical protein
VEIAGNGQQRSAHTGGACSYLGAQKEKPTVPGEAAQRVEPPKNNSKKIDRLFIGVYRLSLSE